MYYYVDLKDSEWNEEKILTKKDYRLDTEEQEILDSFNHGEWVSKAENLDKYKQAAKQTFAKRQLKTTKKKKSNLENILLNAPKISDEELNNIENIGKELRSMKIDEF
jgi:hypothetical protein